MQIAAATESQLPQVRQLFLEYRAAADAEVCFSNFEIEVNSLPAGYDVILVAGEAPLAGCVALRSLGNGVCEMKRLYVRPQFQGQGLGRRLTEEAINWAGRVGFTRMVLDTLPSMNAAIALYRSMGFTSIERYNNNPDPGALFFEKSIAPDEHL